ncbi:hypothetical protein A4R26_24950 [Niastella populi]|uniref:Uncharacterized protein n=1 Tax=Niastella populi TaxID=550983 RepID=A0A1V9FG52_9BACT|nr:hypothetical protein A4R26_24950 [Niastella populi]
MKVNQAPVAGYRSVPGTFELQATGNRFQVPCFMASASKMLNDSAVKIKYTTVADEGDKFLK